MANYASLKAAIIAAIKQNGNNEITGNVLQQQLLAMVNSLGVGYQYAGVATPDTNPGTPDQNVFYIASTTGTYVNFGGFVLADGEIAILKYNGAWSKDSTGAATQESVNQLGQQIDDTITKPLIGISNSGEVNISTTQDVLKLHAIASEINAGETYFIKITKGTGDLTKWYAIGVKKSDGGYLDMGAYTTFGEFVLVEVTQDCSSVGFYVDKNFVTTDGSITWECKTNSLTDEVERISLEVDTINTEIDGVEVHSIQSVTAGSNKNLVGLFDAEQLSNTHKYSTKITNGTGVINRYYAYALVGGSFVQIGQYTDILGEYVEWEIPDEYITNLQKFGIWIDGTAIATSGNISLDVILEQGLSQKVEELETDAESLDEDVANIKAELSIDNVDNLPSVPEYPLTRIERGFSFASMFLKWGFIGDSLSSGCENVDGGAVDLYDTSWGQFLCRMFGATGYNFSKGGQTAKGWCNESVVPERGWSGVTNNLQYAYSIALGVNDAADLSIYANGIGNADTDIDVSDYTQNADSYIGYIGRIISHIQEVQPKAKIFVITLPIAEGGAAAQNFEPMNIQLRKLATIFTNVFIVDLRIQGSPHLNDDWTDRYRNVYHLNCAGYVYFAWLFSTYVDWIVRNNFDKFKDVGLIGTNYDLPI